MPDLDPKGSTNQTTAAIQRLCADLEEVEIAVRHDRDVPTIEREIDGGIRWKMGVHVRTARIALERMAREWTEVMAELQRVEQEADAYHQALADGAEVAHAG